MSTARVAVVTGSNKGIGFAIVKSLCARFKGDIYLTARNDDRGQAAVKKLNEEGLTVKYHQLDIDDTASREKFVSDIVAQYGGLDVLVNNAGILIRDNIPMPFSDKARLTFDTNFFNTTKLTNLFLPHIKKNGRIVHLASRLGFSAFYSCSTALQEEFKSPTITEAQLVKKMGEYVAFAAENRLEENGWPIRPYDVSKLGIIVLTRTQARHLQEQGRNDVLINCCCPGWVRSDLGGPRASISPEVGAETPVDLAMLGDDVSEPNGQFLIDMQVQTW